MIKLITPENFNYYKLEMYSLFKARYEVFYLKNKWELNVKDGLETDEFDHDEAYYLINLNHQGQVIGGVRLISTASFHMFDTAFSQFVTPQSYLRCNKIWESSRFFIHSTKLADSESSGLSKITTLELFLAMNEFAIEMNIA